MPDSEPADNDAPPSPASVQTVLKRNSAITAPDSAPPSPAKSRPVSAIRRDSNSKRLSNPSIDGSFTLASAPAPARVRGQRTSLNTEKKSEIQSLGAKDEEASTELATWKENEHVVELDDFGLPIKPGRKSEKSHGDQVATEASGQDVEGKTPHAEGTTMVFKQEENDLKEQKPNGAHGPDSDQDKPPTQTDLPNNSTETSRGHTSNATDDSKDGLSRKRSESEVSASPTTRSRGDSTLAQIIEAGAEDTSAGGVSQYSHQALTTQKLEEKDEEEEEKWQNMPAYGKYDLYDDEGRLIAKGVQDSDSEDEDNNNIRGGAGKGYTRVQIDEDAKSATSMDENTNYLFKEKGTNVQDEDDEVRDPLSQMQATKDLLTEGQRIAYVGVTRLSMVKMTIMLENIEPTKGTKKDLTTAVESMKMWGQKMMVRLYAHMEIDSSEQIMIEQLAEHGVQPSDLTPALMQNSRVKNPMADPSANASRQSLGTEKEKPSRESSVSARSDELDSPPAYDMHQNYDLAVQNPETFQGEKNIDIDLRWTVLCDLFLILIADSIYDSRSRALLETVGDAMSIPWVDICRFEKRVTDALEMQEQAARENWDEAEHMETRRKMALKKRYMVMGLATVGGGLVIGLSAGLLAPVIGAGLAAGFTTIGVAGTGGFLAGAGGAAIITTGSVVSGGIIAVRASNRRTGAVKTFEYRPLHNNKRVNLIVTVSGWMNGKVDDVRLPFSTVDPIMGDIYSVLWEPDMLQSMGDTIRILATEALTQGLQQVLASTILTALMASLSLPIVLAKLSYLLDNPWSVSLDRADAAGLILADSLVDHNLGVRPITLVGFSLGSRVIFSCLRELANKGAYGLIQNVYLFGSPIVAKKDEYLKARTVVSGRFVNGYATNDWIIGYLFRATSGGIFRVAGLAAVEGIPGLENKDVTSMVNGHMAYRSAMPKLLREVGWEVESDEFTEIEDPDPDNHEARQRELIREIEDARKEAESKNNKQVKKSWWRRGPKEKKGWETYDVNDAQTPGRSSGDKDAYNPVLFDIDAIRAELESEHLEVKQLESTLPPMQLNINPTQLNTHPYQRAEELDKAAPKPAVSPKPTSEDRLKNGFPEPARPNYDHWDEYDEHAHGGAGEATMSFEPMPAPAPAYTAGNTRGNETLQAPARSASASPGPSPTRSERPELKTAATSPGNVGFGAAAGAGIGVGVGAGVGAGAGAVDLGHNAWADEDDEFANAGKGEASMSFE